jgi:acyl-CoA thioester hydrolase
VVRAHRIEYLNPAFAGDLVEATTWVDKYNRIKANRRYRFLRKSDGKILAEGETVWVFIDVETGKPRTIPENVKNCFHSEKKN